jgi:hypothetical protein
MYLLILGINNFNSMRKYYFYNSMVMPQWETHQYESDLLCVPKSAKFILEDLRNSYLTQSKSKRYKWVEGNIKWEGKENLKFMT